MLPADRQAADRYAYFGSIAASNWSVRLTFMTSCCTVSLQRRPFDAWRYHHGATGSSQVSIEGMVHRPAIYELNGERGLNEVLDLAGGVLASASLKQINVERLESHERHTMLTLELPDSADGVKQNT